MTVQVSPIPREGANPKCVVGTAQCPECKQEVAVVNDRSKNDARFNAQFNYFENHSAPGTEGLCRASEMFLSDCD